MMRQGPLTARGYTSLLLGVAATVGGLVWGYPGLLGLGVACLLLTVASLAAIVVRAPVLARRTVHPMEVERHGECRAELTVRRVRGVLPLTLTVEEQVGDGSVTVPVPPLRVNVPHTVEYDLPTDRRGLFVVGPLKLSRRGVGDLTRRTANAGKQMQVRVLPRCLPVRGVPQGVRRGHVGAEERAELGGTDLVGLHEYVPGDDLRRLHWATSARTGTLMVRDDADPARPHMMVLLDDRASSYVHEVDDFDEAVDVAASLVEVAAATGHPVHLMSVSGAIDIELAGTLGGGVPGAGAAAVRLLGEVALTEAVEIDAAVPLRDLDVVAAVTGSKVDLGATLLTVSRGAVAVVLVVDPVPQAAVRAEADVTVLRGTSAVNLLTLWDRTVDGGGR